MSNEVGFVVVGFATTRTKEDLVVVMIVVVVVVPRHVGSVVRPCYYYDH